MSHPDENEPRLSALQEAASAYVEAHDEWRRDPSEQRNAAALAAHDRMHEAAAADGEDLAGIMTAVSMASLFSKMLRRPLAPVGHYRRLRLTA